MNWSPELTGLYGFGCYLGGIVVGFMVGVAVMMGRIAWSIRNQGDHHG